MSVIEHHTKSQGPKERSKESDLQEQGNKEKQLAKSAIGPPFYSLDVLWKEKPRQCIIKQRHHFAKKGPYNQSYGFSRNYVWMWEFDHKEGWALKNWCFWIAVLEKTLESLLESKEIKQSILKEVDPEYFLEGLILNWSSNTLASLWEELTHWKSSWCWERLRAGREEGNRD